MTEYTRGGGVGGRPAALEGAHMKYRFQPSQMVSSSLAGSFVLLLAASSHASHTCPMDQPAFAYVDVDNDGCYTAGVDSGTVDASLQSAPAMANTPSFVGPPDTGLVIPHKLMLPDDADVFWSVPNDVWIDGEIRGPSSVRLEAGGTTYINGPIRLKAKGFSDEGDLRLGCATGCGQTIVGDGVMLANNGQLRIYDAQIGNDVYVKASCSPGNIPCGGSAHFARATSIGDRFRVNSPGGIDFEEGTSLLVIGNDANLTTKSVSIDGGSVDFVIAFALVGGVELGAGARLRAGGEVEINGGDGGPVTGAVTLGGGARLSGKGIFVAGSSLTIGAGSQLKAKKDASFGGQQLSSVHLTAHSGTLSVGDETTVLAGRMRLRALAGLLDVGNAVALTVSGAGQYLELEGSEVAVGTGAALTKSTGDSEAIAIVGVASVTVASSALKGSGLDVSVTDPGAMIAFTEDEVYGGLGTVAKFTAPGGVCDLTGSTFTRLAVDATGCATVIDP